MSKDRIINVIEGRTIPYTTADVDTDEISPTKEALYVLTWEELSDVFCVKTRKRDPDHILNDPRYENATILFAGDNFGCGSSREHAVQATKSRYSLVVAPSFAPIFAANSYSVGLPVVTATPTDLDLLVGASRDNPETIFRVDLEKMSISFDGYEVPIDLQESRRQGFLQGTWNESDKLIKGLKENMDKIKSLPSIAGY